jgi:hypothetical protein
MSIIVKSKDGVEFAVETARSDYATARAERTFALTRTARELESFGDYRRLDDTGFVWAPAPQPPRIAGPQERRAAFELIQGGKQS